MRSACRRAHPTSATSTSSACARLPRLRNAFGRRRFGRSSISSRSLSPPAWWRRPATPIEGLSDRQWHALANALAVRATRRPHAERSRNCSRSSASPVQKLKTVVATANATAADLHRARRTAAAPHWSPVVAAGARSARPPGATQQGRSAAPAARRDRRRAWRAWLLPEPIRHSGEQAGAGSRHRADRRCTPFALHVRASATRDR